MGDKTFSDRVRERASDFAKIYEEFRADYKKSLDAEAELKRAGIRCFLGNPWHYLFEAPIQADAASNIARNVPADSSPESISDSTTPEPMPAFYMAPSLKAAVMETARRLRLTDLRLDGISTNDWRVTRAIELGLLTYDDFKPLYEMSTQEQLARWNFFVTRERADGSDPFLWRTLLEIFCRTFLARPGTRDKWPAKRLVQLGFDLVEINRDLFKKGETFSSDKAHEKLKKDRDYKKKYPDGVGRDQIIELVNRIGPMDENPIAGLNRVFQEEFFEAVDERFLRAKPKTIEEINKVLDRVSKLFGDSAPRN